MTNVEVFRESELSANDVLSVEADHVALATGSTWRKDLFNWATYAPVAGGATGQYTDARRHYERQKFPTALSCFTILTTTTWAVSLAELLRHHGFDVTLATASEKNIRLE